MTSRIIQAQVAGATGEFLSGSAPMQWVSGGGRLILGELCFLKYVWRGPILEQLPLTVYQSFTILE